MSRRTKSRTCRKKVQFRSEFLASFFAQRRCLKQLPYQCNVCGLWHLTSRGIINE